MSDINNSSPRKMKACFLLLRRFAYVGHAMAIIFKKKYGIQEFSGYVRIRDSFKFLQSQKDIHYTQLLLDEDVFKTYKQEPLDLNYIKHLEKEYGLPNLWPYLAVDRLIRYNMPIREYPYNTPKFTHEEMMRMLQTQAISGRRKTGLCCFLRGRRFKHNAFISHCQKKGHPDFSYPGH